MNYLSFFNELLHPGTSCPGAGALGECAAIVDLGPSWHFEGGRMLEAQIYLWPAGRTLVPVNLRSCLIAAKCALIVIQHTLDDEDNGICSGETDDGAVPWTVFFHAPVQNTHTDGVVTGGEGQQHE